MFVFERSVRFEEVDAAGIVFFAHFAGYGHEAMEAFFDQADGGYVGLITRRRIGMPAVKLECDFSAPLRYGDSMRIETRVVQLGNRSATFEYRILRAGDGVLAATLRHKVVVTDLEALASIDMPPDVRAAFEAHHEPAV